MFQKLSSILYISIILSTTLFCDSKLKNFNTEVEFFTKNSANDLYNLNEVAMQDSIKTLFKNDAIHAIDIKDAMSGDTFIKAYISNNQIIMNKPFPSEINSLLKLEKPIKHDSEIIGNAIIYYEHINIHGIQLTQEETNWLQNHQVIKASSEPDYAPWDFNLDGEAKGYSVDYLNLLASKVGLQVEYVYDNWNNLVLKLENNEIDVVHTMFKNDARTNIIYSEPYKKVTVAIYTHKDNKKINNISDLTNELISITEGDSSAIAIKKKYSNIRFSTTQNYIESLKEVAFKKSDAAIIELAVGNYLIKEFNIPNLRIVDEFDPKELGFEYSLHFAVNKDNAILISILNKAMYSLKTGEIDVLDKKWIATETRVDYSLVWKILIVVFLVFLGFAYYNRKLKSLVSEKTAELELLLRTFNKNVIASSTDTKGIITYASDALCEISGYSKEELLGKPHNIVRHPDMSKEIFSDMWTTIKSNNIWKGEIKNRKKDGGYYWVDAIITPEYNPKGELIGYSAIRQDITAKKEIERTNRLLNGRELRMVELKKEINACKIQLGDNTPYALTDENDIDINQSLELENVKIDDLNILLDVEQLQIMMENFYKIMHIPLAVIDLKGNILVQSKWQRACTDFHRANEESCKRCIESDIDLASKLDEGEKFTSYKCQNGLIDCASPIIINGEHVANFFIGQFLINTPNMEYFTNQAKLFGYDEADYIESIKDIPIVNEEMLPHILGFLTGITDVVTSISIEKLKAQKNENLNKIRAIEMQKGQIAAMNLAEDAEKARLEVEDYKEHLEILVDERTKELHEQKQFVETLLNSQEQLIITTDGKKLISANKTFKNFYGIESVEEFQSKYGNCICDTFCKEAPEGYLQIMMGKEKWIDYVINRASQGMTHKAMIIRDDKEYIFSVNAAKLPGDDGLKAAVFTDITELENQKKQIESILDNILLPVLITSKESRVILYANSFAEKKYEISSEEMIGKSIDFVYTTDTQKEVILEEFNKHGFIQGLEQQYKTFKGSEFDGLLSLVGIVFNDEDAMIGMVTDITEQKIREKEIKALHKHTQDSIEYASLIQGALVPDNETFNNYFSDFFTIWQPKDVVGGDIYLFEELRDRDECLLMVIDCTGHGVPGAFVTMLVKALERQVIAKIENDKSIDVSPAWILSYFNRKMKSLLHQESEDSVSNAGFDGGIIYYNKKTKILKYAGAELSLFYLEDDELKTIKGSRQSIGYKKSDANFEFKEHIIQAKDGMQFYCTTDGYVDQNGGEKGFPFGKRKFSELIMKKINQDFSHQKEVLLTTLAEYQGDQERNDDVTVVGFKI